MKRSVVTSLALVLAAVAAVAVWLWWRGGAEKLPPAVPVVAAPVVPEPSASPPVPSTSGPPPQSSPPSPGVPQKEPAPPAPRPNPPVHPQQDTPARQEAEAVALNLRHFGQRFGGNPTGTNAEIVKALNGGNVAGARYLPQENLRLNAQGELLDHFGTPYFFHQLSATEMEVRSAGADRQLWTVDDILVK